MQFVSSRLRISRPLTWCRLQVPQTRHFEGHHLDAGHWEAALEDVHDCSLSCSVYYIPGRPWVIQEVSLKDQMDMIGKNGTTGEPRRQSSRGIRAVNGIDYKIGEVDDKGVK